MHAVPDTETPTASDPLPERLRRLEAMVEALRQLIDVQSTRIISLQAQVDHLDARRSGRF